MPEPMTRREWMTTRLLLADAPPLLAIEAVASTALAHPEWDMDETRTWDEWEAGQ